VPCFSRGVSRESCQAAVYISVGILPRDRAAKTEHPRAKSSQSRWMLEIVKQLYRFTGRIEDFNFIGYLNEHKQ